MHIIIYGIFLELLHWIQCRITTTSQFTPPGTTGTQLLDQAIKDFAAAANLLPASWDAANRGQGVPQILQMECLENLWFSEPQSTKLRQTILQL